MVLAEMHDITIDRWRMVNESCVKSMDPEDWTDSCDSLAAFLDHMKLWKKVMTEFSDTFAYHRVDTDNNNNLHEDRESWEEECDIAAAFLDHRRSSKAVIKQLRDVTPFIHATKVVTSTPITNPQRPTKLIDRRGKPPVGIRCDSGNYTFIIAIFIGLYLHILNTIYFLLHFNYDMNNYI